MNIAVEVTTGVTGIGDTERFHKTMTEKLRIICSSGNKELKYLKIEQALFIYNHIISHSTAGEIPYNIFLNEKQPKTNLQLIRKRRINKINQNRQDNEILVYTNFFSAEIPKKRYPGFSKPYKKSTTCSNRI